MLVMRWLVISTPVVPQIIAPAGENQCPQKPGSFDSNRRLAENENTTQKQLPERISVYARRRLGIDVPRQPFTYLKRTHTSKPHTMARAIAWDKDR